MGQIATPGIEKLWHLGFHCPRWKWLLCLKVTQQCDSAGAGMGWASSWKMKILLFSRLEGQTLPFEIA